MDFGTLPIGFAMALAQNETAMRKYALLPEPEKAAILSRAHQARSEEEMTQIVSALAGNSQASS